MPRSKFPGSPHADSNGRNRRSKVSAALRARSPASSATLNSLAGGMDDYTLSELVARIGALYTRQGLSPPFRLRDVARHWLGLTDQEIIDVIEQHMDRHR